MTTRTFVDKNGNSWEWEETEEVLQALKELHNETKTNTEPTTVG
jgi:hypothetical protein